jgi:excisionase family DNA binding protein
MTTEYNVTVELDTDADEDTLADLLFPLLDEYSGAYHSAVDGRPAVTLTIHQASVDQAIAEVLSSIHAVSLTPWAVEALPTSEFDRRTGLVDVPLMLSVPQAAARLGISEQRVRQLLSGEKLIGEKVGRDWLVSAASVAERLGA